MKTWKKKITAALLAAVCLTGAAAPLTVEAATTTQKIIYGAAALLFISSYYTRMDDRAGLQLLDQCQQQTGVYESAEADNRVARVNRASAMWLKCSRDMVGTSRKASMKVVSATPMVWA